MKTTAHILLIAGVAAASGGCKEGGVSDPTWIDDVRPIMAANCVRCHALPAIGGAPDAFRLDKYGDTVLPDGTIVRGAAQMNEYIAHRAGILGEMPPDYPRGDGQRETLENWLNADGMPTRGERADNSDPEIEITSQIPAGADDEVVTLAYDITDADGDLVDGALVVVSAGGNDVVVDAGFRSGRGTVAWNPTTFPPGDYALVARLTDDIVTTLVPLGQVTVDHGANSLPAVSFITPTRDTLIGPAQGDFEIIIDVADPDATDVLTATFTAVRGDVEEPIAANVPVVLGQATATWTTTGLDDAPNWRVRAVVSDGLGETIVDSPRVVVSNASTGLTFDNVRGLFGAYCAACHSAKAVQVQGENFDPAQHETTVDGNGVTYLGVEQLRGIIYRRVVLERTMPPPSAASVVSEFAPGFQDLPDADRATIAEYLLGGAPP